MGRRTRVRGALNAPETIYARAKTAGWLLKSLEQNAAWDSCLFECLQWVAGDLRRPLQEILKEAQKTTGKSGIVEVVPIVRTAESGLLACFFPHQAAFKNPRA